MADTTEKTAKALLAGMTIKEDLENEYRRGFFSGLWAASAAQAVVDAYWSRFESPHQPGIFGPIDDEIIALKNALAKNK